MKLFNSNLSKMEFNAIKHNKFKVIRKRGIKGRPEKYVRVDYEWEGDVLKTAITSRKGNDISHKYTLRAI